MTKPVAQLFRATPADDYGAPPLPHSCSRSTTRSYHLRLDEDTALQVTGASTHTLALLTQLILAKPCSWEINGVESHSAGFFPAPCSLHVEQLPRGRHAPSATNPKRSHIKR